MAHQQAVTLNQTERLGSHVALWKAQDILPLAKLLTLLPLELSETLVRLVRLGNSKWADGGQGGGGGSIRPFSQVWRRRRRKSTTSIQPAKAYEDESVIMSGPH